MTKVMPLWKIRVFDPVAFPELIIFLVEKGYAIWKRVTIQ